MKIEQKNFALGKQRALMQNREWLQTDGVGVTGLIRERFFLLGVKLLLMLLIFIQKRLADVIIHLCLEPCAARAIRMIMSIVARIAAIFCIAKKKSK